MHQTNKKSNIVSFQQHHAIRLLLKIYIFKHGGGTSVVEKAYLLVAGTLFDLADIAAIERVYPNSNAGVPTNS